MLNIGDKVVCINSALQLHTVEELRRDMPNWVKQDNVYTIRGFVDNNGIVTGVLLEEITNPLKYFKLIKKLQEPAFAQWRFRKQITNQVSVEIKQEALIEALL